MRLATATRLKVQRRSEETRGFSDQTAIFERLEVTKKYGLVSDYLVSWSGLAGHHKAKITVWPKDGTPSEIAQHYVTQLLKGLVPDRQISVAAD